MTDWISKAEDWKNKFTFGKLLKWGGIAVAAYGALWDSWYINSSGYKGVVTRLGAHIETTDNGLQGKIPFTDDVIKVNVQELHTEEFGFRTLKASGGESQILDQGFEKKGVSEHELHKFLREVEESGKILPPGDVAQQVRTLLQLEYLMLTGDLKLVDAEGSQQWTMKDAAKYVFNVDNPSLVVRILYMAAVRANIGDISGSDAITTARESVYTTIKKQEQTWLDEMNTGIEIVVSKPQATTVPRAVVPAYEDVNSAQSNKETKINLAKQEWNTLVPPKIGEKESKISEAQGYASKVVAQAKGEMYEYWKGYQAFTKSPEINLRRMEYKTKLDYLNDTKVQVMDKEVRPLLYDLITSSGGAK